MSSKYEGVPKLETHFRHTLIFVIVLMPGVDVRQASGPCALPYLAMRFLPFCMYTPR